MKCFSISAVLATVAALASSPSWAFRPVNHPSTTPTKTALHFSVQKDQEWRRALSGAVAAVFVATNVVAFPAGAMVEANAGVYNDPQFFAPGETTQVIAARSGGRSGGRVSSGGNSRSYRSSSPAARSSTRSYNSYRSSTTVIAPPAVSPTVVVTPGYGMGYSYNPLGGLATGYALGTLGNVGNALEDARQESEIRQSRYELEQARLKEAELEGRLRALESQQAQPAR